jgi:hypothetical protein
MRKVQFSATIAATVQFSPLFDLPQALLSIIKIVKCSHTSCLNIYTLKYRKFLCIHVENDENKPQKCENLKKPKETIDSGDSNH